MPSNRLITRSARPATLASCVTITIVWPPAWARRSSRSTSRVLALSRLPVGSSASSRLGSFARARARATRCCSPPDSRDGAATALAAIPSSSRSSSRRLRACLGLAPASSAGSSTLSATVMVDSRLKNWKTKPTCLRRSTAHADGDSPSTRLPRSQISPRVAGSRPPSTCSSVDFPEPDGPMTATNSPTLTSRSTPRTASTLPSPDLYTLASPRARSRAGASRAVHGSRSCLTSVPPGSVPASPGRPADAGRPPPPAAAPPGSRGPCSPAYPSSYALCRNSGGAGS